MLYTFLKTGLRKSELINLKWKDIDFRRKYITIESKEDWRTKTGNTREIPIGNDLATKEVGISGGKRLTKGSRRKHDIILLRTKIFDFRRLVAGKFKFPIKFFSSI